MGSLERFADQVLLQLKKNSTWRPSRSSQLDLLVRYPGFHCVLRNAGCAAGEGGEAGKVEKDNARMHLNDIVEGDDDIDVAQPQSRPETRAPLQLFVRDTRARRRPPV